MPWSAGCLGECAGQASAHRGAAPHSSRGPFSRPLPGMFPLCAARPIPVLRSHTREFLLARGERDEFLFLTEKRTNVELAGMVP